MKAPDKIYVAESLIKTPYGNEWSPTPYISRENTEYIRKDALLEWLENKAKVPDSFVNGLTYLAYKDVIDKLNSL